MLRLAAGQPGYLGVESVREGEARHHRLLLGVGGKRDRRLAPSRRPRGGAKGRAQALVSRLRTSDRARGARAAFWGLTPRPCPEVPRRLSPRPLPTASCTRLFVTESMRLWPSGDGGGLVLALHPGLTMRMLVALGFLVALPAGAAELACGPVEAGVINLDGLLDDWAEVPGLDAGGRDPNLSFTVKCNLGPRSMYLLVDVRDDYFARTKQTRPGEDHVELTLGGRKLLVYPGDQASIKDHVSWGKKPARGVRSFGALQPGGWAVELELPLGEIGVRPGTPRISFGARVADCDSKVRLKTDRVAELGGAIAFAEAESALDAFLRDQHLTRHDHLLRQDAVERPRPQRARAAGRPLHGGGHRRLRLRRAAVPRPARSARGAAGRPGRRRARGAGAALPRGGQGWRARAAHRLSSRRWRADLAHLRARGRQVRRRFQAGEQSLFRAARPRHRSGGRSRRRQRLHAGELARVALFRRHPDSFAVGDDRKARYQFQGDEYKQVP